MRRPRLTRDHKKLLLEESGIDARLVIRRGYRTVERKAELERLGFGRYQRNVPALLIPIYDPTGEVVLYQSRPDEPRISKRGKPVKYETPGGERMALDVHPAVRDRLGNPSVPLFITEGVKKGDALVSRNLCAVALIGVWNWRGTNEFGGKTVLAEWEYIALKGRKVYVVFDSDVMEKREVYAALSRLKGFLEHRDVKVRLVYLPPGEGGEKQGVDDFLASGKNVQDLLSFATPELRLPPQEELPERSCPYRETTSGLVWEKPTQNGSVPMPLTNFTARIVRDVAEDDGAEVRRRFEIEASLNERRESFAVPSSQFAGMGWATEYLGASAIVYPGFGAKDHARAAVQMLSKDVPTERVYAHTGWREVGGVWIYLHAGGAIGHVGQVGHIRTVLVGALGERILPDPPEGEELIRAIRASLGVLDLASDRLMFPMLAAVYRALLEETDFVVHVSGPTGEGKSEIAALCQQHHGARLDARNLTSWESTENAIEGQAFQAKDQVMVLDDFAPTGSSYDVQRWHKKADRVLRSKGNASSRQRMRADTTLRPDKPPRALILSTGEDVPRGQSLRARLLVLELAPGELRWEKLTVCQRDAAAGLYAAAVSGYVRWLAAHYGETKAGLSAERAALREAAAKTVQHRRTPGIIADLALGLRYLLHFAHEGGAVSTAQAERLWDRGWQALGEAAADQQGHQAAGEPTGRFRELLSAGIASGRAHVAGPEGNQPRNPKAWGWRAVTVGSGDFEREEWKPQGERVGWIEAEDLYLEPDAAYAAVQKQGRDSGDSLSITERTLRKRLHERGLLLSVEDSRPTLAVRRTLGGGRRRVLHLSSDFLSPHTDQPDQHDHDHQEPLRYAEFTPPLWSGSEREPDHEPDQEASFEQTGQVAGQVRKITDHETDQKNPLTYEENSSVGQVGQGSDDSRDYAETNGGIRQQIGLGKPETSPENVGLGMFGGFEGEERSQILDEGIRRLFEEHPEYRERRPGQVGCRLHMSRYTPFVPTDEEVRVAMKEVL